jgi:hypothetical protein
MINFQLHKLLWKLLVTYLLNTSFYLIYTYTCFLGVTNQFLSFIFILFQSNTQKCYVYIQVANINYIK